MSVWRPWQYWGALAAVLFAVLGLVAICFVGCEPAHLPETPPSVSGETSIGNGATLQVVIVRGHDYLVVRYKYGVAVCPLVQEPRDSIFFRTDTTQAFDMAGNPIGH